MENIQRVVNTLFRLPLLTILQFSRKMKNKSNLIVFVVIIFCLNVSNAQNFNNFAFVSSNRYIILEQFKDTNLLNSASSCPIHYSKERFSVTKDIDYKFLDKKTIDLIGKKFLVIGKSGKVYEVIIDSIKIIAECIPHYGVLSEWDLLYDDFSLTNRQKSNIIWELGAFFLVARLNSDIEIEEELLFSVDVLNENFKNYKVSESIENEKVIKSLISEKLFQTDLYFKFDSMYNEIYYYEPKKWWENEIIYEQVYYIPLTDFSTYLIYNHSGGEPCGNFYCESFSIWKIQKINDLKLEHLSENKFQVLYAGDLNNDEIPEFVLEDFYGKRTLFFYNGELWTELKIWQVPFLDYPC